MAIEINPNSSTRDFEGKVAVITGGSRGIGKAAADELIKRGAKVVIGDILEELGSKVVEEYNIVAGTKVAAFIRTDITTYCDNKALFQFAESEFGGVDIAILNAGTIKNGNTFFSPMEDGLEEAMFNINTTGVIKGSKVALMHMAERGGGSIVCIASLAGLFSIPDTNAYNASKHAVVGYVRSCTLLPAVCNVRVNAICPTWVGTDLLDAVNSTNNFADPFVESLKSAPQVTVNDVVKGIFIFLSEESRNAETLMILPEGPVLKTPDALPDCFQNAERLKAREKYLKDIVPHNKKQLDIALQRYRLEYNTL